MTRKTKHTLTLAATLAGTGLFAGPASGIVIASYDFAGGSATSGDSDTDTTASAISVVGGSSNFGISSGTGTLFARSTAVANTGTDPGVNASERVEFSVTLDNGPALSLQNITGTLEADAGDFWQANYSMFASTDDFATSTSLGTASDPSGGSATAFDISLASLGNVTGTVKFRLVPYAEFFTNDEGELEQPSNGKILRLDDVVVNGTVVPEPASVALMGLGGLLMLGRRRQA